MKRKKTVTIILTVVLLIAGIGTVALYKIGDRVFDEVIDSQIAELEKAISQPTTTPQVIPEQAAQPSQPSETNTNTQQPAKSADTAAPSTTAIETASPNAETPKPSNDNLVGSDTQITIDKLENVKESVTPTDKMAAAKMVLSRLSQDDISHLTQLSAGGITPEEKEEMKAIVYQRFTSKEIEEIKEMYNKYMK